MKRAINIILVLLNYVVLSLHQEYVTENPSHNLTVFYDPLDKKSLVFLVEQLMPTIDKYKDQFDRIEMFSYMPLVEMQCPLDRKRCESYEMYSCAAHRLDKDVRLLKIITCMMKHDFVSTELKIPYQTLAVQLQKCTTMFESKVVVDCVNQNHGQQISKLYHYHIKLEEPIDLPSVSIDDQRYDDFHAVMINNFRRFWTGFNNCSTYDYLFGNQLNLDCMKAKWPKTSLITIIFVGLLLLGFWAFFCTVVIFHH